MDAATHCWAASGAGALPRRLRKPCFFQKHPGEGALKHLSQVDVSLTSKAEYNLSVKDTAGLIELVQMGVLEMHVWGSTAHKLERPDRLIFDLDPDPHVDWSEVVKATRACSWSSRSWD